LVIRFLIVAASVVIGANTPASADPFIRPVLRTYLPVRIALPDFDAAHLFEAEQAHSISRTIAADLKQSGAFVPINEAGIVEKHAGIDEVPTFADWRAIDAQILVVVGRVTRQPDARIKVEFRLWAPFSGKQLAGQQYIGTSDDFSRIGHMISEGIYERITGEKRTFD
jgi:TolB protein